MLDGRRVAPLDACTFIYYVQVADYIKIGCTADWKKRINNIRTSSPFEVKVLLVEINHPRFERRLHKKFSQYRHRGEWFCVTPELLSYVNGRQWHDVQKRPDVRASDL